MFTAILFLVVFIAGFILALWKGPIWGFISYIFLYFVPPLIEFNWWAVYIPDLRWGQLAPALWLSSLIIHYKKLSTHKFGIAYWCLIFLVLTEFISITLAIDPIAAKDDTYKLFAYIIAIFFIIRSLGKFEELRLAILVLIVSAASLYITTLTQGKFPHGRLENVGPGDANGSNELSILLVGIIPLTLPFIFRGKKYEKIICLLSLPLLIKTFTFTLSRSGFVAIILGIIYVFIFIAEKRIKKYILIIGICSVPLLFFIADEGYTDRISTLWKADRNSESEVNELSSGRIETWEDGYRMAKDYPLGTGPGGFRALSRFYMSEDNLSYKPGSEYGVRAAHNSYLLVLVEQGFLGFFVYMMICFSTLYLLLKSSIKIRKMGMAGTFYDLLIIGLNISFICTMFGGFFNSRVYYEFFWWQIALVVVTNSFVMNMPKENSEQYG